MAQSNRFFSKNINNRTMYQINLKPIIQTLVVDISEIFGGGYLGIEQFCNHSIRAKVYFSLV